MFRKIKQKLFRKKYSIVHVEAQQKEINDKQDMLSYIQLMNHQNLSGREDFIEAFDKGVEAAYDELMLSYFQPIRENYTVIKSFIVVQPTNEMEYIGEILELSQFGEYCPANSMRGYSLSFLLLTPIHYRPYILIERGVESVIYQ